MVGFALTRENRSGEELAVLLLVEPGAFEIEERNTGQVRQCERVDRKLRERFVGLCVRFVVEQVDRSVADLHEINVAGDRTLLLGLFWKSTRLECEYVEPITAGGTVHWARRTATCKPSAMRCGNYVVLYQGQGTLNVGL